MGQIFHATAYDIDTKTCCVCNADKFHANCYSYSGAVFSMHYLLRKKPYRIMWGGCHVVLDNNLQIFSHIDDLLGISTYVELCSIKMNDGDPENNDRKQFIIENKKLWKHIDVWEKAEKFFKWDVTHSVKYKGYLLNHTQKKAIDLENYYQQSKYSDEYLEIAAIDLLPVLTETGGGAQMAFFDGIAAETTEKLNGKWRRDLLQIVNELPKGYKLINCCFAEIGSKVRDCYWNFGANKEGYLLKDHKGNLFEAARLDYYGKRGPLQNIKTEFVDGRVQVKSVPKIKKLQH